MYACQFRMNGEDGRLHLKGEAEELRNRIDLHCCQSGAVPGTNLSTDVSTMNWRGRVCIVENIRYKQTFALLKSSCSWELYPPTPAVSPPFPLFFSIPFPLFSCFNFLWLFSLIPQDLDLSNIFLIYPVSGKNEINTFTLALVTILLLKGRYTVI